MRVTSKKTWPCVNYGGLKSMKICNNYLIPILGQLLSQLHGCQFFTKSDLKADFNLLRIADCRKWKTVFRMSWGLYEYSVMPFFLENSSVLFQKFIQFVLQDILKVFFYVYIDKILVLSKNHEEHWAHVKWVLELFQEHKLCALPEKFSF